MTTLQRDPARPASHDAEALIREARRRQRRRHLAAGLAALVVLATAVAAVAGHRVSGQHRPAARAGSRAAPPRPLLAGMNAMVVMWPSAGPESWWSGAYVDDLGTGHIALRDLPGIYGCDCSPYLIGTGPRVVYVAWGGTAALPAALTGRPRFLGSSDSFAPSAAPGHIWLLQWNTATGNGPVRARQVAVTGGSPGAPITLPHHDTLMAGTSGGLLLSPPDGRDLALWTPGAAPTPLPHSAGYRWAGADARLVAYDTACHWRKTARRASLNICRTLRVFNAVTGKLASFPAPAGTAGWAPDTFSAVAATSTSISPAGTMAAAYANVPPLRQGRARLYVLRLTGPRPQAQAVPSSAQGQQGGTTAWTPTGAWLLYQGPGGHLWAYQATTGKLRTSRTPCCHYIGMIALPTRPG
jgi:hypothetical protein